MSNVPDPRTTLRTPSPKPNWRMNVEDEEETPVGSDIPRAPDWHAQNAKWQTPTRSYNALWVVALVVVLAAGWIYWEYGGSPTNTSVTTSQSTTAAPPPAAPAPSGNATAPSTTTTP